MIYTAPEAPIDIGASAIAADNKIMLEGFTFRTSHKGRDRAKLYTFVIHSFLTRAKILFFTEKILKKPDAWYIILLFKNIIGGNKTMKFRKGIISGIAAAAAASVTVSVGAVGLGYSSQDVEFYMESYEDTVVSAKVNCPDTVMEEYGGITIDAKIPTGALQEGSYTFRAVSIADPDDWRRTNDALHFYYAINGMSTTALQELYAFDLSFFDENGTVVHPENVEITLNMFFAGGCGYDIFVEEADGTLTKLPHQDVYCGLAYTAPHFSKYIVAGYLYESINYDPGTEISEPDIVTPPVVDPEPGSTPTSGGTTSKPGTPKPSDRPTSRPTSEPESEPTDEPTDEPASEPESDPTIDPTSEPVSKPEDTSKPQPNPSDKGANTGDSASSVVVFGIMGLAAAATAVAAKKSKKTSK